MRHVVFGIVLLIVFLVAAFWLRDVIARNAGMQQQLQAAQFQRGRLLKLQLDEETGIRGYLSTHSRAFLAPYDAARRSFAADSELLEKSVAALRIDDTPVRRERAINKRWLATVADPALHGALSPQSKKQILGKSLVDAFRANDAALTASIQARSRQVERAAGGLLTRMLFGLVVLGIIVVLVVTGYGYAQNRLSRRLHDRDVEYERERHAVEVLENAFSRPDLPAFPNVLLRGAYAPARDEARVGGDWYDAYAIGERRLLFSIGDVAGHGLEAAVAMSRVRQSITTAAMSETDPAEMLRVANDVVALQEGRLVTVACGFVDLDKGGVTFATAGHPPMLFVRARGPIELLTTGGPPLGAAATPRYRSESRQIEPAAALVLYTDGLTEHGRDTVKGERRLLQAVRAIDFRKCDDPASTLLTSIFSGNSPADDVAILTLTFTRAAAWPLRMLCA